MNEYHKKLIDAGHVLVLDDDGKIDSFAYSDGYHNGPSCSACGMEWCHHCRHSINKCKAIVDGGQKEAPEIFPGTMDPLNNLKVESEK